MAVSSLVDAFLIVCSIDVLVLLLNTRLNGLSWEEMSGSSGTPLPFEILLRQNELGSLVVNDRCRFDCILVSAVTAGVDARITPVCGLVDIIFCCCVCCCRLSTSLNEHDRSGGFGGWLMLIMLFIFTNPLVLVHDGWTTHDLTAFATDEDVELSMLVFMGDWKDVKWTVMELVAGVVVVVVVVFVGVVLNDEDEIEWLAGFDDLFVFVLFVLADDDDEWLSGNVDET